MARIRLDLALVERGLCPSREQAKRLIMAGEVLVGEEVVSKPGWLVPTSSEKLIYLPQPEAPSANEAKVLPLGLNLSYLRLADLKVADFKLSDLNPMALQRDHLPVGY
jgi:ribosomal protein S4